MTAINATIIGTMKTTNEKSLAEQVIDCFERDSKGCECGKCKSYRKAEKIMNDQQLIEARQCPACAEKDKQIAELRQWKTAAQYNQREIDAASYALEKSGIHQWNGTSYDSIAGQVRRLCLQREKWQQCADGLAKCLKDYVFTRQDNCEVENTLVSYNKLKDKQ